MNLLLKTDVYKMGHLEQYPRGTTKVYSYLCARSNKKYNKTLFFGLQYYLKKYLSKPISHADVDEFLEYRQMIVGDRPLPEFEQKLRAVADLDFLPLKIKAVPEGSIVENKNVLLTITNTHRDAYWLVGLVESLLLKVWNTCTVATYSMHLRNLCETFAKENCDDLNHVPYQVHDFGYRGCSSEETAELSGAAHLVNFLGTDTVPAVKMVKEFYNGAYPIGLSVPATEHSVMCAYGEEREFEAFKNMLALYPRGIVSIVSDSYNYWRVMTDYAPRLAEEILCRHGKVVFRPDSGNPLKIICGDPKAPWGSPEQKGSLEILWETFGGTVNGKGFRVLNPVVGLIYGEGMTFERITTILNEMHEKGFASSNIVFGIGGLLLQQHTRDDLGFALKATYIEGVNEAGEFYSRKVKKDPVTDKGKASHSGPLVLHRKSDGYYTHEVEIWDEHIGLLEVVFQDSSMREVSFEEIRAKVRIGK